MERLFKCSYTGRIFDNELDCLKYEYEQGGKKEKYLKLIVQFLDYLKSQGVQIVKAKYDARIKEDCGSFFENKFMTLDIQKEDGEVEQYYKNTDPVGDGRYIECFDSLERMIKDFQSEFVTPNTKVFEGWLNMYHSAGEYWIQGSLDDFNIDDILYSLDGKKIRIEVIEEMKED